MITGTGPGPAILGTARRPGRTGLRAVAGSTTDLGVRTEVVAPKAAFRRSFARESWVCIWSASCCPMRRERSGRSRRLSVRPAPTSSPSTSSTRRRRHRDRRLRRRAPPRRAGRHSRLGLPVRAGAASCGSRGSTQPAADLRHDLEAVEAMTEQPGRGRPSAGRAGAPGLPGRLGLPVLPQSRQEEAQVAARPVRRLSTRTVTRPGFPAHPDDPACRTRGRTGLALRRGRGRPARPT